MYPENTVLNKTSWTQKEKYYMISLFFNEESEIAKLKGQRVEQWFKRV